MSSSKNSLLKKLSSQPSQRNQLLNDRTKANEQSRLEAEAAAKVLKEYESEHGAVVDPSTKEEEDDFDLGFLDEEEKPKVKPKPTQKQNNNNNNSSSNNSYDNNSNGRKYSEEIILPPSSPAFPAPALRTYNVVFPPPSQKSSIDLLAHHVSRSGSPLLLRLRSHHALLGTLSKISYALEPLTSPSPTPAAVYFWWRTYSFLHGSTLKTWSTRPFELLKNTIKLIPPSLKDSILSNLVRSEWSSLIQRVKSASKRRVNMCLRFCVINVSDCVLISSLLKGSILEALEGRKYDRMLCLLGVVNDLLYNGELVKGVWGYRKGICEWLEEVFGKVGSRLKEEGEVLRSRVGGFLERVLLGWERWGVWEDGVLDALRKGVRGEKIKIRVEERKKIEEEDIDGEPMTSDELDEEEDIDGEPMTSDELDEEEDIDGEPLSDDD
ncbi:hypothetical protein TrST_g2991 [Triparma strigata]|uniref:Uncharacterized protein n=1 Tax=Triparma strigata TaxID=1606541 RepID=A0A9W7AA10_9STRA|nr:hypothetical protein TrST_g2991 [Triparma strigata]